MQFFILVSCTNNSFFNTLLFEIIFKKCLSLVGIGRGLDYRSWWEKECGKEPEGCWGCSHCLWLSPFCYFWRFPLSFALPVTYKSASASRESKWVSTIRIDNQKCPNKHADAHRHCHSCSIMSVEDSALLILSQKFQNLNNHFLVE